MQKKQYKHRHLEKKLPPEDIKEDTKKLVLITGARQTGKTTIARNRYASLHYFNLDAPEIREKIQNISTYNWVRDIGVAILDEVQKEPIALEKIKFCFDEETLSFSVLLGSSQLMLLKKVRESLAGRVALYELFPFMISEIASETDLEPPLLERILLGSPLDHVLKDVPSVLFGTQEHTKREAHDYLLQWGGMPALFTISSSDERKKWLKDYEYT